MCLCGGATDVCQCNRGLHIQCLSGMLVHGHTKCNVCKADFNPQVLAKAWERRVQQCVGERDRLFAKTQMAIALRENGDLDDAYQVLQQVLRNEPRHTEGALELAELYLRMGLPAEAHEQLKLCGSILAETNFQDRKLCGRFVSLSGLTHLRLGNLPYADEALRDAINVNWGHFPNLIETMRYASELLRAKGDVSMSLMALRSVAILFEDASADPGKVSKEYLKVGLLEEEVGRDASDLLKRELIAMKRRKCDTEASILMSRARRALAARLVTVPRRLKRKTHPELI